MNPVKVFAGVALLMMGVSLLMLSADNVSYGGVLIIGPVPIVVASDVGLALPLLIFAAILVIFLALAR